MSRTPTVSERSFSREGWTRVRFGDVVENVTRSVPDPLSAGLERFVGLDHLDPRGLCVRRWGQVAEGTSFTRHFLAGEVLFGKRRAYQRKASVADFDGVCSGDLLVFRARADALLPDLLLFIVQSDAFVDQALGTSAGSLSPRTRWKDLANFEFRLPPLATQADLARVLGACAASLSRWRLVSARSLALERAVLHEWLAKQADGIKAPLGSVLTEAKYGTSVRCSDQTPGATAVLRIPNVVSWFLDVADLKWAELSSADHESFAVKPDDLLMVRTNGNPQYVGRCALVPATQEEYAFASYLLRLRFDRKLVSPDYMWMLFQQPSTRQAMVHLIRSSAGNYNLSASGLASLPVPIPELREQHRLVEAIARVAAVTEKSSIHVRCTDELLRAVENEIVPR